MHYLADLAARAGQAGRRIILVEGQDERVREAATHILELGHLDPILLIPDSSISVPPGWKGSTRYPSDDGELHRYAELFVEIDGNQGVEIETAREQVADPLHFAAMMVHAGDADGAVAGAVYATADVIRAALRCIGTARQDRMVTGAFYMVVPGFRDTTTEEVLTFADSGVIPEPDVDQLVAIADQAARMRRVIVGDEPRVAFLSYSTHGSADGPSVKKVREASRRFRQLHPDIAADGELQVDAALIPAVGGRKAEGSPVAGVANVLIFPDLAAGNIAYKLVERLAGATAIGPILHGLDKPFNDLSRGADPTAIESVAYVTALMARGLDQRKGPH